MDGRSRSAVARGTCAASVVLFTVAAVLLATSPGPRPEAPVFYASYGIFAGYAVVGGLVAARRPGNAFGWALLAGAALGAVQVVTDEYATRAAARGADLTPLATTSAWVSEWAFFPHLVLTAVLPLFLFPTGRPHARWARRALAVPVLATLLLAAAYAAGPVLADVEAPNPFAAPVPAGAVEAATAAGYLLLMTSFALGVVVLVARYRASRGTERQQMKWFAYGVSVMGLCVLVMFLVPTATGRPLPPPVQLLLLSSLLAVPVTAAIAILRHRLYDVDVVISRTLAYTTLAFLVTALYAGVVAAASAVLGGGGTSLWRSAAATVVVAVAFHPLRERLQRLANRVVYGHRATPYETLSSFAQRMSGALSVEGTLPRIAEAAARGVGAQRARATVLLRDRETTASWPEGTDGEDDLVMPVEHEGERMGSIGVTTARGDELRPAEVALLRDLASQAGLVLRNVRLTMELQDRLTELAEQARLLQQSRARLVTAQDAERRRLERDLHDGAQQSLVSLSGQLRLVSGLLQKDPQRAAALTRDLVEEADQALAQVRDLARGIFPVILGDRGLAAALRAHVGKHLPDGQVVLEVEGDGRRPGPDVESAVYFCCLEALQNVSKHAPGARVAVTLRLDDDRLHFSVADDGPGFDRADVREGTGLLGMADRTAALGGTLTVRTRPGGGTVVEGHVPLAGAPPAAPARPVPQVVAQHAGPAGALVATPAP